MDVPALVRRLETFPTLLAPAIAEWSVDDARWRPVPGAWSVVEIVAHLLYAEVEDFRPRLARTLEDPTAAWTPIDPEGVVTERDFQSHDPYEDVRTLERERAESVRWLRTLPQETPWENTYEHPSLGALRAGDLLAAWTAHDALHLRQLAQRRFEVTERDTGVFSSEYAGRWPGH